MRTQMGSIFFTQGTWSYMSGMIDVLLKSTEDGQTNMRLAGPKMHGYTMSTCYFLGQRPEMTIEIIPLNSNSPTGTVASGQPETARASAPIFTSEDGVVVTPFVLVPKVSPERAHGAGSKR